MADRYRNTDIDIVDTAKPAKPFYQSLKARMRESPDTTDSDSTPSSPCSSSDSASCPSTPGDAFGLSGDEQYFDTLDAELGLLPSQFEDVLAQVYAERYAVRREKREGKDVGRLWESRLLREQKYNCGEKGSGGDEIVGEAVRGEGTVQDWRDEMAVPKKKGKERWTWMRDDADMEYDGDIDEGLARENRADDKVKEHRCKDVCMKRKRKVKTCGPRK